MTQPRHAKPFAFVCALIVAAAALAASSCSPSVDTNANRTANANANASASPATTQTLTLVDRPQGIKDQMAQRGQQDEATPALRIMEPADGATVDGANVAVRLDLSGELRGYAPGKDPATGMGNHIHVILDNAPYEAYYDISKPFELRNVTAGTHTLRVFASRPWHESYKNEQAFDMVTFTVRGGGDASQPTTASTGQRVADNKAGASNANTNANANASASPAASPTAEGKDMSAVQGGASVDESKPLLTYSRPKGEYKGEDANAIMIDFWLKNAQLQGQGGQYRVRYSVDGGEPKFIDRWEPIWLTGWTAGKHTVRLELVDASGNVVDNGGYNATSRDITVVK
ncbi:MAG TPA: hypothetical protein VGV59_18875 [Pyrinomonadaceae bacterium]|nr:hypothetical protein [Pyrinomonadaceae bacterium]